MTPRRLLFAAAACAALSALSILTGLDVAVARAVDAAPPSVERFFRAGTEVFDHASGKEFSNSLLPAACLALALLAWLRPTARRFAKLLVLVALCNYSAHSAVSVLKSLFGRLRPYQIAEQGWVDHFFAGGASLPSGHTGFYFGIALPLAWAFPRWRVALLLPAAFVGLARVMVNDHFAGDVLGSLAIALAFTAAWIACGVRTARLEPFGAPHPAGAGPFEPA